MVRGYETMFTVAKELVTLRRGKERIVFNAEFVNPVYFPRGGDEALTILERLKALGPVPYPPEKISPPDFFKFLCDHSLIVPEEKTSSGILQKTSRCECETKSSGKSLYLLLSHSCNQKCIYCLNGRKTYQKNRRIMMSEKVAFKAVETVFESISRNGRLEVVFFGGEPLLNWRLAKKIINYCETMLKPKNPEKKIQYHLTTNLTIFPDDLMETARKYKMTFLVNVDGPPDIHDITRPFRNGKGSFKTTARNIRRLINAGFEVALRATVTKYNHHRMLEIAETHKELGGAGCAFVPLNAIDSDEDALSYELCPSPSEFAKGLKKVYRSGIWPSERLFPFNEYMGRLRPGHRNSWGCGAPWGNTPVINAEGKIFSCIYLVGIPKFETGDIFAGDFPRKEVVDKMLEIVNVDNNAKCSKCGFRYLCGGGCPVGRFTIAGNPNVPPEIKRYTEKIACVTSKTVLSELLWDMGKQKWKGYHEEQKKQKIQKTKR